MEQEDRLSNLPIIILHSILSRLPVKYVVQTSVLSKTWTEIWSTFPYLFFPDTSIIGEKKKNLIETEDYLGKRKKFIGYVDKTLLRFRNQGLSIKQFGLSLKCFDLHNLSKDVDLWLQLVSESVEVLKLWQPLDEREEEEVNNFREFIQNFKPLVVLTSVSLCIYDLMDGLDPVDFQVPSLPPSVKHLDLQVELKEEARYLHIVHGLFSNCCPTTISFLYVTLMDRNEFGCYDKSCHYGDSKCWLHCLKDVKLESPMKIVKDVDFKNMLDKFENSERDIIFKLEF